MKSEGIATRAPLHSFVHDLICIEKWPFLSLKDTKDKKQQNRPKVSSLRQSSFHDVIESKLHHSAVEGPLALSRSQRDSQVVSLTRRFLSRQGMGLTWWAQACEHEPGPWCLSSWRILTHTDRTGRLAVSEISEHFAGQRISTFPVFCWNVLLFQQWMSRSLTVYMVYTQMPPFRGRLHPTYGKHQPPSPSALSYPSFLHVSFSPSWGCGREEM